MTYNSFIMVTPAKNEEQFLPKVIESVVSSTLFPLLWVIVDDNSSDNTCNILKLFSERYNFIKIVSLTEEHPRDLTFHYSYVCKIGFNHAMRLADERNINWDYIVLLDADTILDPNYLEGIFTEMNKNPKIGIASGNIHILTEGKIIPVNNIRTDIPSGTARVWRKKCFYDTGGYIITQAPDSVSRVKAKMSGWDTVRFSNYNAYQLRRTSSASGLWNGFVSSGKAAYYVDKHPLLVFLNFLSFSMNRPFYVGIPFLYGYFYSLFKRENQIDDLEVKDYFHNKRLKELIDNR